MKHKFLESRQIGRHLYKAYQVPNDDPLVESEDGVCDTKKKLIFIAENPEVGLEEILEHEFGHAWLHESYVRDLDSHLEHVLVESLAEYIMDIKKNARKKSRR